MDTETIRFKNIASAGAILVLLLAIPEGIWPYGYFVLLRWIVAGIALFVLWTAYNLKMQGWVWLMASVAILFNPILPVHLDKGVWQVIDFIVASLFLFTVFKVRPNKPVVEDNS